MPSNLQVLVVDDDVDTAESTKILLEMHGYRVATAHQACDAVELCKQLRPDIVLLDLALPDMDGWEAATLIRQLLGPVFLVAITGQSRGAGERAVTDARFDAYFTKPTTFNELLKALAPVKPLLHGRPDSDLPAA